jgi:hypothetical protein
MIGANCGGTSAAAITVLRVTSAVNCGANTATCDRISANCTGIVTKAGSRISY